jgi:nicotinamidase/pyrazinamidase
MATQTKVILWEVDTQADFMLPGGKLYVPGAEKLISNIKRLADAAREGRALLISSGDQHPSDDPEFEVFPPHCVRGTPGAEVIPEALLPRLFTVPNDPAFTLPADLTSYQQVLIEKQTFDVFENPQAAKVLQHLPADAEFLVFGVVTEYCVNCAAKGLLRRNRRVTLISDAIQALDQTAGLKTIAELTAAGAHQITVDEALARLGAVRAAP